MPFVRVDAPVGEETHEVEGAAALAGTVRRGNELPVFEEGAVPEGEVDAQQVLGHHPSRSEVQVSDLGVAHQAGRQPDGLARGLERRAREVPHPAAENGLAGERDRVA